MSSRFSLSNFPWVNNLQNAVDSAVHDISQAADNVAEGFRGTGQNRQNQRQQQQPPPRQQQQPPQHQQAPFPFFFPGQSASQQPPPPTASSTQRTPVASTRAIRQLPTILVAPEDLVDEKNRECCICMEPNCLGEKVTRLPCAHIFHSACVVDWLENHHCTCPICRYELPTDDPLFEAGRGERMRARKPRFAKYELERMSIKELVELNRGRRPVGIGEKKDLVQFLIDQERIDLIPAPEPVEYKMEDLEAMRVSKLKRAMEDAGVFFHAKDVIEKSDMILIFVNSGRLNVIPADYDEVDEEVPVATQEFVPSENLRDEVDEEVPVATPEFVPSENLRDESSSVSQKNSLPCKRPLVETVEEDECSDTERENRCTNQEDQPTPVVMFPSVPSPIAVSALSDESQTNSSPVEEREEEIVPPQPVFGPVDPPSSPLNQDATTSAGNAALSPGGSSTSDMSIDDVEPAHATLVSNAMDPPGDQQLSNETQDSMTMLPGSEVRSNGATNEPQLADCPLGEYTVSQLLSLGQEANIDLSSCFERSEMVNLLVSAGVTGRARVDLHPSRFADWSVSQLRAVASEVNIDLSQCTDQTEIIDRILEEANSERPHLRNYLRVLSPLTTSSLSQLRSTARAWDVDISDCLEKEEIIQRLITRANQFGIC